jgi:Transposase IS4
MNRASGSRNIPHKGIRPGVYLSLLFSDDLLQTFVQSTNSYVANQQKPAWTRDRLLTLVELKKYFGIVLYMGIVKECIGRVVTSATIS